MMPITKGATWCTGAYACQACQKQQKPQIGQSNSDNVKCVSLGEYRKSQSIFTKSRYTGSKLKTCTFFCNSDQNPLQKFFFGYLSTSTNFRPQVTFMSNARPSLLKWRELKVFYVCGNNHFYTCSLSYKLLCLGEKDTNNQGKTAEA